MKIKLSAGFSLFSALAFACATANNLFADQVFVSALGHPIQWSKKATNSVGSVTVANSDATWSIKATAAMGRIDVDFTAIDPPPSFSSSLASGGGRWDNTITIQPDNPALLGTHGTAVFTYHVNGSQSLNRYAACMNWWNLSTENGGGPFGQDNGNGTYSGQRISDEATYTVSRSFTFGGSVFEEMALSGNVTIGSNNGGEGKLHVSLAASSIAVSDDAGNSVAYSSTSSAGVARAAIFANGAPYAGFSVTNNLGNQTVLSLLGGANTAGTNETLSVTYTSSPDPNQIISDVADLSSSVATNVNSFVVQMSYDPAKAIANLGGEANALLVWFNPANGNWVNAVEGNSDGGLAKHSVQGAYNPATDNQLGTIGLDTAKHVVWAVLDHHSQFAVGVVTPPLQFAGISTGTNGTSLMLSGPQTGQFFIDYSSSLAAPGWTLLGLTTLGTNGTSIFNDATSVSANPQRFYRARQ